MKISSDINALTKFHKEGEFEEYTMFKWQCPLCVTEHENDFEDRNDFIKDLIVEVGMRYVESKTMHGFFCGECIKNGDLDNASL